MTRNTDTDALRATFAGLRHDHLQRQLARHLKAARGGARLEGRPRLRAALHLCTLYKAALPGAEGGRDALEAEIHDEICRTMPHRKGRTAFRIARWTLPASVSEISETVVRRFADKSEPQKTLGVYLAAAAVLGRHLGEAPELAQAGLLRAAGLWNEAPALPSADDDRFEAAQELDTLLHALCDSVARRVQLDHVLRSIGRMPVAWCALTETLRRVQGVGMVFRQSPVLPEPDIGTNIDEIVPFPSVPLVRVPLGYLDGTGEVERLSRETPHTPAPEGKWEERPMRVVQFREIRLGAVPVGGGRFGAALESRGAVGVRLDPSPFLPPLPVHGTLHWYDTLTWDQLIRLEDGWHRLRLPTAGRSGEPGQVDVLVEGPGDDYDWENDPVELPGQTTGWGADYVSWTRCTPDHLAHWLMRDHALGEEPAWSPWHMTALSQASASSPPLVDLQDLIGPESYWADGVGNPLPPALLFDRESAAAVSVRACLDNGLLERGLLARAERVRDVVQEMETSIAAERRRRHDTLLSRWQAAAATGTGATQ